MIDNLRSDLNLASGSLNHKQCLPFGKFQTSCNPLEERIKDHDEAWNWLGKIAIDYNWRYRKKVCSKCTPETKRKLRCQKINKYRIIDGVKIQETHCSKLEKARAKKLSNHIKHVQKLNPLTKC